MVLMVLMVLIVLIVLMINDDPVVSSERGSGGSDGSDVVLMWLVLERWSGVCSIF